MFKINRKIEYALIALKHMSHKSAGQLTSAKEIADVYQTPFDPTSRVLQLMAQKGILQAEQGAKGGYQIIKDLNTLTLGEVSDVTIGPIEIANCFHGNYSSCNISSMCHIIAPMLNLNEKIKTLFRDTKIAELLESKHQDEESIRNKIIKAGTQDVLKQ